MWKQPQFFLIGLLLCAAKISAQQNLSAYVNPFIGTGGHGHTYPGAALPFGMVQLSPDTRIDGSWDGCSGYHYSDSLIYGFSHTHLSGTGCTDYGDIMLMPMPLDRASFDNKKYSSSFKHSTEKAGPGWYEVQLETHGIKAELAAGKRIGMHRYTYKKNAGAVVIDLRHRDKLLQGKIEQVAKNRIRGYRTSEAWAKEQHCYYEIEFSENISEVSLAKDDVQGDIHAIISFGIMSSSALEVRVGISFTSMEGAHINLEAEKSLGNFNAVKRAAETTWEKELSRILLEGGTEEQKQNFYTALYHTLLQPNDVSDVDGKYRGMDKKIHTADHPVYSVFSLWDTFRAAHPLYALLYPEKQRDFIRTFLLMYQQGGRLPVWELAGNETDCMIGYHSVSVIADSWFKGIRDFDSQVALNAMVKSATWKHLGLPAYMDHNYLSIDDEPESVSKTLEYAYDDWCIGRFADALDKNDTAQTFFKRSESWRNLFDAESGFMRPRKNGTWLSPFAPEEVNNHFTEANSWQYSFFVPHNIAGLAEAHGGKDALINKLQTLFTTSSKTSGREQADITGLIGQYAHGNEPSHHMAWLFTELGEPDLSQEYVAKILNELYSNNPDGLSGNEDCGQMSAWYIWSAMGLYPLCPGKPQYTLGNPIFDKVRITAENGTKAELTCKGKGKYVSMVNGRANFRLEHEALVSGKPVEFTRSDKAPSNIPLADEFKIESSYIPAPALKRAPMTFRDSITVELTPESRLQVVRYTLDGRTPSVKDPIFPRSGIINNYGTYAIDGLIDREGIVIRNSCTLRFASFDGISGDVVSPISTSRFFKIPHTYTISILSKYNPQYTAGGDQGIIDGLQADENWRKGGWQGYQAQDFECVIDLQKAMSVFSFNASFLQDTRSWIVLPTEVEFMYSVDGVNWNTLGTDIPTIKPEDYTIQRWNADVRLGSSDGKPEPMFITSPVLARYVKVKARNFGKLPDWHVGAGGEAFIFIDEITVH
jgi:predicted alpha-1,2-mannosidase